MNLYTDPRRIEFAYNRLKVLMAMYGFDTQGQYDMLYNVPQDDPESLNAWIERFNKDIKVDKKKVVAQQQAAPIEQKVQQPKMTIQQQKRVIPRANNEELVIEEPYEPNQAPITYTSYD